MKNNIKENFGAMFEQKDIMEQFFQIFDIPDKDFAKVYPKLKTEFEKVFNSPQTQKQILNQLSSMSNLDATAERQSGEAFIKEIESDESLSLEKKDVLINLLRSTISTTCDLIEIPREKIPVKILKCHPDAIIPTYAHPTDAGADICSVEDVSLKPHTTQIIKTGLKVEIPIGYMINIAPRSGLSAKTTLRIANSWAIIDSDYRGEIGIIVENTGNLTVKIEKGQKIAQMLIMPTPMIKWEEVAELSDTDRGSGGFGSTDKS